MTVTCRPLDPATEPAWDKFVDAMPTGTFFHRAAWAQVFGRAFGHTPHYVVAEQDGAITGILPLVHVKTRLFGNSLMSSPFCVYGGPLAADAATAEALETYAAALMQRVGAKVAEFRFLHPLPDGWLDDEAWPTRADLYVTFRRAIVADDEANLKAIPRKQRAMVRKGIDRGLTSTTSDHVDGLHAIYAESVRNLGTPVFSRAYFRILADVFRDRMDVVTIHDAGAPVAAVLNFYDRDEVLPYYGGGTSAARSSYANDFMYWEVMRRAAARGARLFDFGRSKAGTGAFAFKKNWGFVPEPLRYRYRLAPGAGIPDHNPLNPKYRLFIAAWKRLPVPVANVIGPHIVRGIG
ncbi:MAG: FemAB family PEP-CTERM system-associated protein [Gemmatimonadaceae bacterium]|nr:FemAB family PEP-CTERM system-associated protein [Acetobacteraceae bacterium]